MDNFGVTTSDYALVTYVDNLESGGPSVGARSVIRANETNIKGTVVLSEGLAVFTVDTGADELDGIGNDEDTVEAEYSDGQKVYLTSTTTLPAGLAEETAYYVINADADSIQLSLTYGGSAVSITDTGTGTHSIYRAMNGFSAGPITVENGGSVTVPYGSTYTVI